MIRGRAGVTNAPGGPPRRDLDSKGLHSGGCLLHSDKNVGKLKIWPADIFCIRVVRNYIVSYVTIAYVTPHTTRQRRSGRAVDLTFQRLQRYLQWNFHENHNTFQAMTPPKSPTPAAEIVNTVARELMAISNFLRYYFVGQHTRNKNYYNRIIEKTAQNISC